MSNRPKIWVAGAMVVLCSLAGQAGVITNILTVSSMTDIQPGSFSIFNTQFNGLRPLEADYSVAGDSMMGSSSGLVKRGLLYTTMDSLGMTFGAGTYTMTLQVGMSTLDSRGWAGMLNADTAGFNRADSGFIAGMFTQLDSLNRSAYTFDYINAFNQTVGVTQTVVSDAGLSGVDLRNAYDAGSIPAALLEDTWYDVTYTWEITEVAATALENETGTIYVGFGGATDADSLWLGNAQFTYEAIPEPATIGLFGVAALAVVFVRRLKG